MAGLVFLLKKQPENHVVLDGIGNALVFVQIY